MTALDTSIVMGTSDAAQAAEPLKESRLRTDCWALSASHVQRMSR